MGKSKIILVLFFLYLCQFIFCNTTGEPAYTKKETLYSTKNGSPIGELSVKIEARNSDKNNNEWFLILGSKNNEILDSKGDDRSLWIFNKKVSANNLKKELKNKDYPIDIKDFTQFMPFCENGIRFDLKDWDEIKRQTQLSFYINASPGEKITLRLVFYSSSQDKKKTIIDDEAKLKIEFVVPDPSVKKKATSNDNGGEGEVISLTEKIDRDAAAKIKEEREAEAEAEAAKQEQEENRGQKLALVNSFITERNKEINSLHDEVDFLLKDFKDKVEESKIDSLEIIADELKKKVDYWENGYSDILLTDESVHDKFAKFGTSHTITTKKITELKLQQNKLNNWISYIKQNWLLSIGIAAGVIILGLILIKVGKKLIELIKKFFTQTLNNFKTKKQNKKQQKQMEERKKNERQRAFESIDINELDEI